MGPLGVPLSTQPPTGVDISAASSCGRLALIESPSTEIVTQGPWVVMVVESDIS